jgi:putrescine transport system permease protein
VITRRRWFVPGMLAFGFAFLYVPILSMIVYSFNSSRLVTVWDSVHSPTLKWYRLLFQNTQIMGAARLSLGIATLNACIAVVLGTLAGLVLVRFGRFRGRTLLGAMTAAPLVMPEIITGLSMLMLFVAMERLIGWPAGRGITTITIAHVTFSMAYVTVIIQSRLVHFDESLEEAAMDLGARPATVFWRITLPLIMPAIVSGWLLSFTLSWDDVVISQFVAGPSSTTLPMVIFSKVRLGVSPDVNALATLMVLVVATGVVASAWWMRASERRRMREMRLVSE